MTERVMAVYDIDAAYADRFADFVNKKEKVPFKVVAFTTLEHLKRFAEDHDIEILLINAAIAREETEKIRAKQVIVLADGELIPVEGQYPSIYKYQATENIVREVMACYCTKSTEPALAMVGSAGHVIGIYSPVGRCLKTSFALTVGQVLSRDTKTLYMNFEDCSGFTRLMGETYQSDLSDLLYYFKQGSFNCMRLNASVYSWGDLDYIPPVRYPEDLCQISAEEIARLLQRIARESVYEVLVMDLGQLGKNAAEILEVCDAVYMPVKDDCVSAAKVDEFDEYLALSGKASLKEKIQKVKLPYHSNFGRRENYLDQLLWGELGDYTRKLLKGLPF